LTTTKQPAITPAVAAKQPDWHVRAAAEYFAESRALNLVAKKREAARQRFIEHTRLALPAMGLDSYLAAFKIAARSDFAEAEPVIVAIAAELDRETGVDAERMTVVRRLLDAAILLLNEPATVGQIEYRGSK
jgi:hypothetical protein